MTVTISARVLPTLLARSRHVSLSAVHRGLAFEKRSLILLQDTLSMSLRHVGGKSDGGIDLMGWWWLPNAYSAICGTEPAPGDRPRRRRLRILAQCKAEKKKISPHYVREMEGVLLRYAARHQPLPSFVTSETQESPDNTSPTSSTYQPCVALLVSQSPFTSSTILRAQSSSVPFFLIHIPPLSSSDSSDEQQDNGIGTAIWNPALGGEKGLLGGRMEVRWERSANGGSVGRPGLWWDGKRLGCWTPEDDHMDLGRSAELEPKGIVK